MTLVVKYLCNSENWAGFPERRGKPGRMVETGPLDKLVR